MSQYVSGLTAGLGRQIDLLVRSMEMIAVTVGENLPATKGQMETTLNMLRSDLERFDREAGLAALFGQGPRAATLRCVYGQEVAEAMIADKLPKKRTDTSAEDYRGSLHPVALTQRLLARARIGERNGYHRWSFDDGKELNDLYVKLQVSEAVRSPFLTREGVYKGCIGDNCHYGSGSYTLVVRFKAEDGSKDETLVFIPSSSGYCHYLTYCPLEETWVMHTDSSFIDEPTVNRRVLELVEQAGLRTTAPTLEEAYQQIYAAASMAEIPVEKSEETGREWMTPGNHFDDKREYLREPLLRVSRSGNGRSTTLSLRVGNDVLTISRTGQNFEDPLRSDDKPQALPSYRFGTGTQCLIGPTPDDWLNKLPVQIRLGIVDRYIEAISKILQDRQAAQAEQAASSAVEETA